MEDDVGRLLLEAQMDMDRADAFRKQHKRAFRSAFDLLEASFPPRRDPDYFQDTLKLMKKQILEDSSNRLIRHLAVGVYNYLSEIVKDIPGEDENNSGGVSP